MIPDVMESIPARLYRSVYRIRRVEEEVAKVYPTDKVKSPIHLSIGQEAVSVGVCEALRSDDAAFGTYRGHALYLAKGGDLGKMVAELYGKADGCTKGKGGSMHLSDVSCGMVGTSAVVGSSIPEAIGYAWARRRQGRDTVALCMFGDGAVEEGVFYESLNLAALKNVPVLFVCENNQYAIHAHLAKRQLRDDIDARVRAFGVPSRREDGSDVAKVYEAAVETVASMRRGGGPFFFEFRTYRWKEHVGPEDDFDKGYRSIDEARPWLERDPVRLAGASLSVRERARIDEEVEREVREAFLFAERSPFPVTETLLTDVLKD